MRARREECARQRRPAWHGAAGGASPSDHDYAPCTGSYPVAPPLCAAEQAAGQPAARQRRRTATRAAAGAAAAAAACSAWLNDSRLWLARGPAQAATTRARCCTAAGHASASGACAAAAARGSPRASAACGSPHAPPAAAAAGPGNAAPHPAAHGEAACRAQNDSRARSRRTCSSGSGRHPLAVGGQAGPCGPCRQRADGRQAAGEERRGVPACEMQLQRCLPEHGCTRRCSLSPLDWPPDLTPSPASLSAAGRKAARQGVGCRRRPGDSAAHWRCSWRGGVGAAGSTGL